MDLCSNKNTWVRLYIAFWSTLLRFWSIALYISQAVVTHKQSLRHQSNPAPTDPMLQEHRQLEVRQHIRLHRISHFRRLLKSIRRLNERRLGELSTNEADSERKIRSQGHKSAATIHRHVRRSRVKPKRHLVMSAKRHTHYAERTEQQVDSLSPRDTPQ
jgi:hypothetical protein